MSGVLTHTQAHFRRAVALERMGGDWREAVAAFLLCLHYDSSEDPPLINRVCKVCMCIACYYVTLMVHVWLCNVM